MMSQAEAVVTVTVQVIHQTDPAVHTEAKVQVAAILARQVEVVVLVAVVQSLKMEITQKQVYEE